jgi:putative NADH-flavin reductase
MKIGVIGATGKAGSRIMKEALDRGHDVTAIVRDASKLTDKNVKFLEKDIADLNTDDLIGFDAVVNAFGAPFGQEELYVLSIKVLIEAIKGAPDTRLLVVGGAGSLFVDEARNTRLLETPEFPYEFVLTAINQMKSLEVLKSSNGIKWTFLSPADNFDPNGKKTGSYKKGKDNIIYNSKGESYVSYSDYAVAMVDEIENPCHINERFTIVSERE